MIPSQDFDRLYSRVPEEQRELLRGFRASHPYRVITTSVGRWRYLGCGEGNEALLFMPGAFLAANMWFYTVLALVDRYRIVLPDSYTLQGTFDMGEVVQALLQILDAEGIEQVTFIGLSASGGVAQLFLQEHPDRVKHAVFSHCGLLEPDVKAARQLMRLLTLVKMLPMWIVRQIVLKRTAGSLPPASTWVEFHNAYFREMGSRLTKEILLGFLQGAVEVQRHFVIKPESLASWPGEILLLGSRDDEVAVSACRSCSPAFPGPERTCSLKGGITHSCCSPRPMLAHWKGFWTPWGLERHLKPESRMPGELG